ncbi:DNA-3-methyladenine glycosylase II (plasmid) [Komagataeibacter europaeus]|nr:DNA-3-methyladenine glycosylase II [Komagataeibacter europaeus]
MLKDIAPSTDLRQWFGHDPARWNGFQQRYSAELLANPLPVQQLLDMARAGPLTLLYGARDKQHNEAVVLAAYLRRLLDHAA